MITPYYLEFFDGKREWFATRTDALVRFAHISNMFRNSQIVRFGELS